MTQDDIERFISELRAEADTAHFSDLTEPAIARVSRPTLIGRLRTRTAAIAATVLMTFGGLGGVAYAANGAVPGDVLYGLDRALEAVGIGNGGSAERLEEVTALVEQGHAERGLEHAAAMVEGNAGAQAALLAAAERIGGFDRAAAHEGVAALLTYLSENVGSVDGATVAELAQAVKVNDAGGPPEGVTPGGPPDNLPSTAPPVTRP